MGLICFSTSYFFIIFTILFVIQPTTMLSTLDYGIFLRFFLSDFSVECVFVFMLSYVIIFTAQKSFSIFFSLLFYRVIFLPQLIKMCQNGGNRREKNEKLYTFFFCLEQYEYRIYFCAWFIVLSLFLT